MPSLLSTFRHNVPAFSGIPLTSLSMLLSNRVFPRKSKIFRRMFLNVFFVLYVSNYLFLPSSCSNVFTEATWQRGIRASQYTAYSSISLTKYSVPYNTFKATWLIKADKSDLRCENRTIIIYVQHGSYPVINPLNETFPDNFYLERTDMHLLKLQSGDDTHVMSLSNPLPGHWFAATFLGDYVDDSIKQKGIGLDCNYFHTLTHIIEAYTNIDTIVVGSTSTYTAEHDLEYVYKFHTSKNTWSYSIQITECIVSDNSTGGALCPLLVATRGQALPSWDTGSTECGANTTDDNCTIHIQSPPTNDWNFILLKYTGSNENNSVTFRLNIELKECVRLPTEDEEVVQVEDQISVALSHRNASFPDNHTRYSLLGTNMSAVYDNNIYNNSMNNNNNNMYNNNTDRTLPPLGIIHDTVHTNDVAVNEQNYLLNNNESDTEETSCTRLSELGRYEQPFWAFQTVFSARIGAMYVPNRVLVSEEEVLVITFAMQSIVDSGGTLYFELELMESYLNDSSQAVIVESCIMRLGIPRSATGVSCEPALYQVLNTTAANSTHLYFPYPESGPWFITMLASCYDVTPQGEWIKTPCRQDMIVVSFTVNLGPCVQGCGEYGYCREYFSGVLHFTSCYCKARYRGFACSDNSVADSDGVQLASILLLTLSNLAFLPAIIVATYRRFYVEALVYFYTMFFSTFYHACDGDSKYIYCMMPYNVLSHCDFFGAIMSVWVTLITMARLTECRRSFLFMLAALGLAIGVTWDKHSLGVFLVPAATALGIMALAWGLRCRASRQCYPSPRRWLFFLVPGVLIALCGLIIFGFFETERNYRYTHSCWHACMALCIVLLLPPRQRQVKDLAQVAEDSTCSSITLVRVEAEDSNMPASPKHGQINLAMTHDAANGHATNTF